MIDTSTSSTSHILAAPVVKNTIPDSHFATRKTHVKPSTNVAIHDLSAANLHLVAPCPARKPSGSCAARRLRPITRESDCYGELVAAAHTGSTSPDVAEPICQRPPQIKALWHWPPTERLRRLLCIHPPRGGNSILVCRLTSLSNDNVDPAPIDGDVGCFRSRWRDVSVGGRVWSLAVK